MTARSCAGRSGSSGPGYPLLGVNLGHVGFLAEAESSEIDSIVDRVVDRSYTVEERFTIDVDLRECESSQVIWSSYAINEVSIEKAARERMLEVLVEVDGRPLSRWACDGMLVATPTGSTAYAFSAGGPVVWPGVDALLVVPLSAHALFARPLVLGPTSTRGGRGDRDLADPRRGLVRRPAVGRAAHRDGDRGDPGQRTGCGWPGSRRPRSPIGWCTSSGCASRAGAAGRVRVDAPPPTTDTTATADDRGAADHRPRGDQRGDRAAAPGLTVVTGETGAGKTMIVTGLGLLLGGRAEARSRTRRRRAGSGRGPVHGRRRRPRRPGRDAGGELDDEELLVARHLTPAGVPGHISAARRCRRRSVRRSPVGLWSPSTASPSRCGWPAPERQRELLDRFAGSCPGPHPGRGIAASTPSAGPPAAELDRLPAEAQSRAREIDLLSVRAGRDRAGGTRSRTRTWPWPPRRSGSSRPTTCRLAAQAAMAAVCRGMTTSRAGRLTAVAMARKVLQRRPARTPSSDLLAGRLAEAGYLLADVGADLARLSRRAGGRARAGWSGSPARRSALAGLTRKYGASCGRGARLGGSGRRRG